MKYIYTFVSVATVIGSRVVVAQTGGDPGSSGLENPIGATNFADIIAAILDVVVTVGVVLVVLAIIYAGYLFVTAQGNTDKIEEAKKTFMWTIVGAIILLGAEALSDIIVNTAEDLGISTGL